MTKSPLKLVPPAIVKRTVTAPGRKPNAVYGPAEVDRLIDAAKRNRWGHRDATMILVAYRHRLSEGLGKGTTASVEPSRGRSG